MKLLITGASGLLGHRLAQLAMTKGHEVYSIYNEHIADSGAPIKLDLTGQNLIFKVLTELKPETLIHTAAHTNVDDCEVNKDLAMKVNAEATKNIAKASANIQAHLTYVSTDYVFDGEKGLYTEEDTPNPINYYGYTKLKGEDFTKEHGQEWCIARASVIYGWRKTHNTNFAAWLISNLKQQKEVRILTDQYVSPTLNTNLAEMLLEISEKRISGILHTAGATRVNRHEFALRLAKTFNLDTDLISPARMSEIPWKAKRPKDSSLDAGKSTDLLNSKPLELNQALKKMKRMN